jgi:ABC-type glycerol-3-phosphate transport system substrate-binding protein
MRDSLTSRLSRRGLMRGAALGATAAVGGTALSACAPSAGGGSNGGKTTVTVMSQEGEFSNELIERAQEALGFTVKRIDYDPTKLTAMLASNTAPDLVRGLGALDTSYVVARDLALPLDDYFAASELLDDDDIDPVNDLWRYDGTRQGSGPRYGMAKDYSQDAMYWYNTALLDDGGVAHPSDTEPVTYAELLEMGQGATQRDGDKFKVYGLSANGLGVFVTLMNMTASGGGALFSEDLSTLDFASPEATAALQWYLDYARAKVGPSVVDPNPDGWDGPAFQAGRMAIATDGYWFGGMVDTDELSEVARLAPAPQFGDRRISPCFGATGMWITKASKQPDEAFALFEWYFGGPPAEERAASGWGIPSLKHLRDRMPQEQPHQQQSFAVQEAESAYFDVHSFSPYARVDAFEAVLNKQLPDAINGDATAGGLADKLNDDMNQLLAEGKELVG